MRRAAVEVTRVGGPFGCALTVDVEEWYHNCLVPSYVQPHLRPELPVELDRLLPELLELLAEAGCRATFFVLGEVAERLPRRVREIARAGHEVASHGFHHLRACERPAAEFERDIRRSKALLEDLVGMPVRGFRAPEWSLRTLASPLLPLVAAAGFEYDSSLVPYSFSGRRSNPVFASRLRWGGTGAATASASRTQAVPAAAGDLPGGAAFELLELPVFTFGGALRVPAGSWTGRLFEPARLVAAAERHRRRGGLPVAVSHPWEISGRPTPGPLSGLARFIHETGRAGYLPKFRHLLAALPWRTVTEAAGLRAATAPAPHSAAAHARHPSPAGTAEREDFFPEPATAGASAAS
jgi:polysaccharide deacetylase family protein (PEP-CTERM system associated)